MICSKVAKTSSFAPLSRHIRGKASELFSTFSDATPITQTSKLEELWNRQVHKELYASQAYLAASIWCRDKELEGMAKYMRKESDEEREHALAFIDFGQKKEIPLKIGQVGAPPTSWKTVEDVWNTVLELEQENTQSLFALNQAASGDPALITFLQPFHLEQVESEDELRTRVARVADESKTPGLVRQMDQTLESEL